MRKIHRYFADVVTGAGALPVSMSYRLSHGSV
jgi:hypothetical protein